MHQINRSKNSIAGTKNALEFRKSLNNIKFNGKARSNQQIFQDWIVSLDVTSLPRMHGFPACPGPRNCGRRFSACMFLYQLWQCIVPLVPRWQPACEQLGTSKRLHLPGAPMMVSVQEKSHLLTPRITQSLDYVTPTAPARTNVNGMVLANGRKRLQTVAPGLPLDFDADFRK